MTHEREHYEIIRTRLEELLQQVWDEEETRVRLEIAEKGVSNLLENWIHDDIRNQYLRQKPDLAGAVYFEREQQAHITHVGEIKSEELRLKDFYQAFRYSDLYAADTTFLITTQSISDNLRIFFEDRIAPIENELPAPYQRGFVLMEFNTSVEAFTGWLIANEGPIHVVEPLKSEMN